MNWLHNGQPTGAQDLTTTEDGAYFLNGANDNASLLAVTREVDAKYFLPNEDEWYKAAYYSPTLNGGAGGYYNFAMQTDNSLAIDNDILPVDPGASANYKISGTNITLPAHPDDTGPVPQPVASDVGEFENSASYYGTFDQSGNMSEFVHEIFKTDRFIGRGGNCAVGDYYLSAGTRHYAPFPTTEGPTYGFRVGSFVANVLVGDLDEDGDIDGDDIDLMGDYIRTGVAPTTANYDLSDTGTSGGTDGNIDIMDLDYLVRFLVKFDSSGDKLWSRQIGTSGGEGSYAVALDPAGNAYISGYTSGSLGGPNAGSYDAFLTKFDASGNELWRQQIGTSSDDVSRAVAVDASGNAYIAGHTKGGLGGPNAGREDAFLTKFDAAGNELWSWQIGTSGNDRGRSVALDAAGNVYISGKTYGDLGGPSAGLCDAFLVKFEVPEPATMSLLAMGACLPLFRRKRRQGLALLRRRSR